MTKRMTFSIGLALVAATALLSAIPPASAQNDAATAPIRAADEQLVKAFDAGKADDVAALFLPQGELIDENGTVYQGQAEIKGLLSKFFDKVSGRQADARR